MSNHSNSQCQLFQLHIDAYLDGELEPARAGALTAHMEACAACRQELAYAELLHQAVSRLPILDCPDSALEPVDRLFANVELQPASRWQRIWQEWLATPAWARLAVPTLAALLLAVGLGTFYRSPSPASDPGNQATVAAIEPQYSQAEIIKALQDLELAIGYLSEVSERTEVMIEDRFLLRQLQESINATFTERDTVEDRDRESNGPI